MKVYVLMAKEYEDVEIKGVFPTREKAEEEMKRIGYIDPNIKTYYGYEQYRCMDNEMEMEMNLSIIETEMKGEN